MILSQDNYRALLFYLAEVGGAIKLFVLLWLMMCVDFIATDDV